MLIKLFKLINDYKSNTTRFIMKFENATRFSAGKLGIGNAHRRFFITDDIASTLGIA
jgi:prephenate dehydratase